MMNKSSSQYLNSLRQEKSWLKTSDWEDLHWGIEILDCMDNMSMNDVTVYFGEMGHWPGEYLENIFDNSDTRGTYDFLMAICERVDATMKESY